MTNFKFNAWIHPKTGGDDYQVDITISAETQTDAEKFLEKWLKKRSDVVNDYQRISTKPLRPNYKKPNQK